MAKARVIYIAPSASSFIQSDIEELRAFYSVQVEIDAWHKKWALPLLWLEQMFLLPFKLIGCKALVISFGGYWSVIPVLWAKIIGVRSFIILNGTDTASIPEIGYGSLRKKSIKTACELSYRNAHMLLPVSDSLIHSVNTYFNPDKPMKQGIKFHFSGLNTPTEVVYNGLNENFWKSEGEERKPLQFVTVFSNGNEKLKGADLIIDAARKLPDCDFLFVGASQPAGMNVPDNVKYVGRMSPDELRKTYNQSAFYLQLSVFEGFGCALCEAMLCGCIPVVSSVNMLPEIIGESENVLTYRNADELVMLLQKVISATFKPEYFRNRVVKNYSLDRRINRLKELIDA
jgi:glycosyltransferase involved in cell wall biosynthesis